jgi:hypothetical protein
MSFQRIGFDPAGPGEGRAQPLELPDQRQIDRVTRQAIAGQGESRHAFALQDLEPVLSDKKPTASRRGSFSP